jgi:hypothetical protein
MLPVWGKDNVYNIYVDKPETDHLEDLGAD